MKNKMLAKTIPCLAMAWMMSIPNAVGQNIPDCELFCQYMGISPSWLSSGNPNEIDQQKMMEMDQMTINFRQLKKERRAQTWRNFGAFLLNAPAAMQQGNMERARREQEQQAREQAAIADIQRQQAQIAANDARPRNDSSRPYADNTLTSRQNNNQQYYPVGTTSNGQLESARQLENNAIANGQSRYVTNSEVQQRNAQNEGTTVIGMELTSTGRISHTLKVDYSRSIPRVNAVKISNPQNPLADYWQYFYIDAQPNRSGTPKECKWYVTIQNRTIYF